MVSLSDGAPCDMSRTLNVINGKWKVLILYILQEVNPHPIRYSELRRSLGEITEKMLTAQLRGLEQDKLIARHVYAEVPPRVDYRLTERGRSMLPILEAMQTWGATHTHTPQTTSETTKLA